MVSGGDITLVMSWGELLMLQVELARAIRRNGEIGAPVAVQARLLERVEAALFPHADFTASELVQIRAQSRGGA